MNEVEVYTETTVPDMSVLKTEIFDVEMATQLMNDKNIPKQERDKIRRINQNKRKGNQHDVSYILGKNCKNDGLGRLCALRGEGLQTLSRDIRSALTINTYWDIDMINAQPILLAQLCKKNGLVCNHLERYIAEREELLNEICEEFSIERWEAKDRVITILFGGAANNLTSFFVDDLFPEIRKIMKALVDMNNTTLKFLKPNVSNRYGKGLAYLLQTIERNCLLAMDRSLSKYGYSLDVLIHDGGFVRRKNEGNFPIATLRLIEKDVFTETGYNISLIEKPIKTSFEKIKFDDEVDTNIIINEKWAAEQFVKMMGEYLIKDQGIVWAYDETKGIWCCDESFIHELITNKPLQWRQQSALGMKTHDYAGVVKNSKNLLTKLPFVMSSNDGWMRSRIQTDIGKLLFKDGIYDFRTATFTPAFNHNIVFTNSMPRNFPIKIQDKINFIRKTSFIDPFIGTEDADCLLFNLMTAMIGDYTRKKYVMGLGDTNSGKGMLIQLISNAVGSLCSTFNGNDLLCRYAGGESSRENGWIMNIHNTRFAFSSEIRISPTDKNSVIDGNQLKTITSGGDAIKARGLYKDATSIINKSTLFMLANDIPPIHPIDDAIRNRTQVIQYGCSFVNNPTRANERQSNPDLSRLYGLPEYGDAFFWLMVEEYEKWRNNDFKEPALTETALIGLNDIMPLEDYDYINILQQKYEITKNAEDCVLSSEVFEYLTEMGVKAKVNVIGRQLKALGFPTKTKSVKNKNIQHRTGMKMKD